MAVGHEPLCPVCKDPRLVTKADRGVAYSVCGDCNGLFISEPQLYKFIQVETQSIAAARAFVGLFEDALAEDAPDGTHLRACPVCRADLERFGFGEHPMSIADRCPGGHGLWLDDGDLEKVVRCSRAVATVEGIAHGTTRLDDAPVFDSDETLMVCPNCQKQFPETETRCGDCNVSLFRS